MLIGCHDGIMVAVVSYTGNCPSPTNIWNSLVIIPKCVLDMTPSRQSNHIVNQATFTYYDSVSANNQACYTGFD